MEVGVTCIKSMGAFIPGQVGIEEYGNKVMLGILGISVGSVWLTISILRRTRQVIWLLIGGVQVVGDMEGFGLVALEAALCGTPVLAAGIEGIRDAVQDGKNGYLLPSKDAKAWKSAIHSLLSDTTSLYSFGQQAKAFTLDNYGWGKMAAQYGDVFNSLQPSQKSMIKTFSKAS